MLSLPSKPWKTIRLDALGEGEFRLTFVTKLENEQQFDEIIDQDIQASLGPQDRIGERDWPSLGVVLNISDLAAFKRKLVFASIMIDTND